MTLSQDVLERITELGAVFATVYEVAVSIGVDPDDLKQEMRNPRSEARKAYERGKVASSLALKAQEMKLAKLGSPIGLESVWKAKIDMTIEDE